MKKIFFIKILFIHSEILWLPSRTDQVPLPFRFRCLYNCMNHVYQYVVVKYAKSICRLCHNNEIVIKYWWHKFQELLSEIYNIKIMVPWCIGNHHCTISFNKVWTQTLRRFKPCLQHVGDLRWWESLTMVPAGNMA